MELLTWTFIIVGCAFVYHYFKRKLDYFENRGIPYVRGWPIFGSMGRVLLRQQHVCDMIIDAYNANADAKYFGMFDFTRPLLVVRDPELIKNIAIKNFDHFPDHQSFADVTLDPIFGGNLFGMTGERWREARTLLSPAFTSSKMKGMYDLMIKCGENFASYIANQSDDANKVVATKDLFTKYTNDVVATCAFGVIVNSLEDPKNEFYILGKKATNMNNLSFFLKFLLARYSPNIMRLLKIRFMDKGVQQFFENIVATTVATRDEKGISRPDMLQLMMDARVKDNKYLKLDVTEMTAHAFVFFFGGFETTATQMCTIAHELAINPDVQKKLQDEIDDVLKETDGNPTYEAINGMQYLDAVFNETVRCHTINGFAIDRVCMKALELPPALPGGKPFTLEPGMVISIPAIAIHKDPTLYEDPEKFNPDRYYGKKVSINDVTNLAFGIGPRSCIGNRFAILEIKIVLFSLLAKFTLRPNVKTCDPFIYSKKSFTIEPEGGYWLTIERRI